MNAWLLLPAVSLGGCIGIVVAALLRAADDCDCQLPTLGAGSWLIGIDEHGEMSRCEPHACFETAFARLEQTMRKDEA